MEKQKKNNNKNFVKQTFHNLKLERLMSLNKLYENLGAHQSL